MKRGWKWDFTRPHFGREVKVTIPGTELGIKEETLHTAVLFFNAQLGTRNGYLYFSPKMGPGKVPFPAFFHF